MVWFPSIRTTEMSPVPNSDKNNLNMFFVAGEEVAEDYRAHLSIANESDSVNISFNGPVLAVDR